MVQTICGSQASGQSEQASVQARSTQDEPRQSGTVSRRTAAEERQAPALALELVRGGGRRDEGDERHQQGEQALDRRHLN